MSVSSISLTTKLYGIAIIIFLLSIILMTNAVDGFYHYTYILSFSFSIYLAFLAKKILTLSRYLVFWIILLQQFLRYVLIPILVVAGNEIPFGGTSYNVNIAIFMQVIELLVITIALYSVNKFPPVQKKSYFVNLNIPLIAVLIFSIILMVIKREYFERLNFIFSFNTYLEAKLNNEIEKADAIMGIMFPTIRIFIILFLFSVINKIFKRDRNKFIMCLIIIFFNSTLILGTSRFSIIYSTLPLIYLLILYFPKYKRKLLVTTVIMSIFVIGISSINKYTRKDREASASDFLSFFQMNAYFSGVANYAIGIDAYDSKNVTLTDHFYYFISDVNQNLPGLASLSDNAFKTNIIFNDTLYGKSQSYDQIVPISIAGLFHFSFWFFYIYCFILTKLAFFFERKSNNEVSSIVKAIYVVLAFNCSTLMMINIGSVAATMFINILFFLPFFKTISKLKM
ncbi:MULTISPECIES: hypothetical protein [unclassified Sphingobacterium]|uniref:hypothetical protein n=1 Tax=unclassified Sphingobacterium TaxID=2609468 RepID=UPI0025EFCE49|nr:MULTISPECIES: hypothetical protein [unclassified Sphingobacterium]